MTNFKQRPFYLDHAGLARLPVRAKARMNPARAFTFLLLHIPLAILMSRSPAIATLHAFATFTVGLWWAVSGKAADKVAYAAAYIVGSEILWRMTGAGIFWETGKYAITAIFIVALLRHQRLKPKMITLVYLGLLLPSALLTISKLGLIGARESISFYLSGHLALIVSVWFFSNLTLTRSKLQKLLISAIGPILGIASVSVFGILSAQSITFTEESNFATSGGFGPNQVAAALGLGALLALLYILDTKINPRLRVALFCVMLFLAAQAAMTFSRGGLYNASGAAILASFYLVREAQSRFKVLAVMALVMLIGNFLIVPSLNEFTGGTLLTRFQDTNPTGRVPLVLSDLNIWSENLVLGTGLGQSKGLRGDLYRSAIAHTEFSRLLSEHGSFGFMIIVLLLLMAFQSLSRARTPRAKALVAALLCWSFLFMLNAAMRLAAPSLFIGLTFATILAGERGSFATFILRPRVRRGTLLPPKTIPVV